MASNVSLGQRNAEERIFERKVFGGVSGLERVLIISLVLFLRTHRPYVSYTTEASHHIAAIYGRN